MPSSKSPVLSIIVPMYNEEGVTDVFFEEVDAVLDKIGETYEYICINDGSKDKTLDELIAFREKNPSVKIIDFSRNFGKEAAMTAGLDMCSGDAVIVIDADLQDPPELMIEMVEKWREGYDVVYGTRTSREHDSILKRTTSSMFYRFYNLIADMEIPDGTGDYRLMDKRVVEVLRRLPESNRFMKGLFSWVGFKQTSVLFHRQPRTGGTTKWNYWRLWNFALDGITAFSTMPLRVWSYIGLLVSCLSFVYATFLVVRTLILGIDIPGYASLMVVMLFLGGVQLISLGVLGEYLGRIYQEVKKRPVYLVNKMYGIDK